MYWLSIAAILAFYSIIKCKCLDVKYYVCRCTFFVSRRSPYFRVIGLYFLLLPFFTAVSAQEKDSSSFYMGVRSNMLYDALLVPNIGVELYWKQNWSVACNWMYAWWKNDHRHHYWRVYGGDLEVRYWLNKAAEKPLKGHHIGLYGQMLTYDFELGGEGVLADKWTYGCGVSYGYSLPVARRLNIDFTAGVGYLHGLYKKYLPVDNHYVWQSTHKRNCIFPTKVEISLVWLIGNENPTRKRGGRR